MLSQCLFGIVGILIVAMLFQLIEAQSNHTHEPTKAAQKIIIHAQPSSRPNERFGKCVIATTDTIYVTSHSVIYLLSMDFRFKRTVQHKNVIHKIVATDDTYCVSTDSYISRGDDSRIIVYDGSMLTGRNLLLSRMDQTLFVQTTGNQNVVAFDKNNRFKCVYTNNENDPSFGDSMAIDDRGVLFISGTEVCHRWSRDNTRLPNVALVQSLEVEQHARSRDHKGSLVALLDHDTSLMTVFRHDRKVFSTVVPSGAASVTIVCGPRVVLAYPESFSARGSLLVYDI